MAGYEAPGQRVIVDMSKVREADTQGLAPVITAASRLRKTGGWLGIAVPDERTLHLLKTTGLVRRIPVFDTVEDARAAALLSRDGDFQEDDR
jgi:anti-anti-sigma factor